MEITCFFFFFKLIYFYLVFQVVLVVKNLSANAGDVTDTGSIPGSGRPLEEGLATVQFVS